jgi:hypothetical protein
MLLSETTPFQCRPLSAFRVGFRTQRPLINVDGELDLVLVDAGDCGADDVCFVILRDIHPDYDRYVEPALSTRAGAKSHGTVHQPHL